NEKQKGEIAAIIPAQKFGTPTDIAAGCLYLASNEGGYITGQTLHINGGMAMV
ncbi:MAG: SDR family oxidoreductase, partial [Hyphomicrobium sp.]